ncbi:MAG: X-Pro dipeptidyl-peptidase [Glaciecola sp.]
MQGVFVRRQLLAVLVAALVLPGAVAASENGPTTADRSGELRSEGPLEFAPEGQSVDRFEVVTQPEDVYVSASDGLALHARLFRPDTSSEPDLKLPVILTHSPYYEGSALGGNDRSIDIVEFFTPKGYAVALTDARGTGGSGGCAEQDGLKQADDFKVLVEHFAALAWSNGKVGSYGKSYDAETQNAGGVLSPNGLATMVTVAGISGLYDVAFYDGVPLGANGLASAAIYLPYTVPTAPPGDPFAVKTYECQPENFLGPANATGDMTQYWQDREFRLRVNDMAESISVLHVHGLGDPTVTPIAIDGWYDFVPGFTRAIWGQWGHKYPYDAPANLSRDDWYQSIHAWFDFFLLDLDTEVDAWPPVQVQDDLGVWRGVNSFSEMGTDTRLALGSDLALGGATSDAATVTVGEDSPTQWSTAPFAQDTHLTGRAVLDLVLTLDRPDAHFALVLEEVSETGAIRKLTDGWLSAMHRNGLESGELVPVGAQVLYRLRSYPFDAVLSAGSSLRMRLSGNEGSGLSAQTLWTGEVLTNGESFLTVQIEDAPCGLAVTSTQEAFGFTPGCPDGIPTRPEQA